MTIRLLRKLVSVNSIYPHEGKLGRFLKTYLETLNFRVSTQTISPGRFNIFASRGAKPKLLFYGHLDTTPSADLPGWSGNPFTLKLRGDRLTGLGAYDMKGGIFAFLEAVKITPGAVKIFLAVDEENISAGAWAAVQKHTSFFKGLELIVSAEPNFGFGDASITVGRTGRVIYQISFQGKSAHIARQSTAVDAIALAGVFIDRFYTSRTDLFLDISTVSQIRKIQAESVGMSVCDQALVEVEVLSGPKDSQPYIAAKLKNLSHAQVTLKPRITPYLSGYRFDRIPFAVQIAEIVKIHSHLPLKSIFRSSVADDNVLATLKTPVITWGPTGGNAHAANEYVNLSSLKLFISMYTDLLKLAQ